MRVILPPKTVHYRLASRVNLDGTSMLQGVGLSRVGLFAARLILDCIGKSAAGYTPLGAAEVRSLQGTRAIRM